MSYTGDGTALHVHGFVDQDGRTVERKMDILTNILLCGS